MSHVTNRRPATPLATHRVERRHACLRSHPRCLAALVIDRPLRHTGAMTDAASDFRLYHSNSLDVLAALLASAVRTPVPGQSILVPEVVLIPQVAMRRWLQSSLAVEYGIAANLDFLTPGEFVARALNANVPGEHDDLTAAALRWKLYAALTDPDLLAQAPMRALQAYLSVADPLKPWALADELAAVFEKYQAWRRDWLLRWEAGADAHDPQAILWRHIASGHQYRARRIDAYLSRFEGAGQPLPQGLPARVFAFATLNISPDVLRVMATQARVGTLHFYLPTPTQAYWGDLQTLGEKLRSGAPDPFGEAAGENRLLQAWGAAGRDFMAVLGSYEVVHPSGEIAAYDDPEDDVRPDMAHGGLADSLLHRLQRDLFHRRGQPAGARRDSLRRDDPSLQVHACHTRLRELQVLHDQLRGLLQDPRFDPPLQAREIAVLAPDIDPYVPYLEAVFGGRSGGDEHIPYALADTSPLAGEPLADVFVHLLGLPVSRFGLNEVLDLLASAPLADAAGLDAAAFDRLHDWLQAAGARWGLDAQHRQQHQAPRDDAFTWQFALDRLLLGHASGGEGDIAGVAPWPELEGSALDALDRLLALLRVLARYQQALGKALPPAQWRTRLLGMLDALLPEPPQAANSQRALERLRKLINEFARDAAQAGFAGDVAPEVVRAHFAGVLAEADTRAPLLTGGISFGRMVPMRLLPFRVICVLGLNDGDFPRRDPAAGLNQLTAELGTDKRRHGDRSLREDDRFLFLQLFASAQDVFYLSYLGADPRDGSVREPSVLVSELIDAAAAYHQVPADAARQLTVRHSLQPFAPAAFGGGDEPRRFSYRQQWHPAAGSLGGQRRALAAWFDAPLPVPETLLDEAELSLDALRRFLTDPASQFLSQRLGLRLPEDLGDADDVEPLVMATRGSDTLLLQQAVIQATLEDDATPLYPRLRARALLPSGALGERQFEVLQAQTRPYAQALAQWQAGTRADSRRYEVEIDGVRLHGRVEGVHPQGLVRLRPGPLNARAAIRHGLDWLLANAAGDALPLVQFHDAGDNGLGPHERAPLGSAQARQVLRRLLQLRHEGLRAPLLYAPSTGWALYTAVEAKRDAEGRAKWYGSDRSWGESSGAAYQLALRGRDPFATADTYQQLLHNSLVVFTAVCEGRVFAGLEPQGLAR